MDRWEDALVQTTETRVNRRAHTQGLPVRDNTPFSIVGMRDGYGWTRESWYYRRHLNGGIVFTGPRQDGLALHVQALI